ncbi:hypothetical protein AAG570_004243 [Ranatra chinensis]|uniref:Uncharacterized protein n=1 Tax=Ranatra chinensis TaxID=642074 RepID=A0ABD0Y4H9_9HEMI
MASKRQNVFHKNKKQGTTEIAPDSWTDWGVFLLDPMMTNFPSTGWNTIFPIVGFSGLRKHLRSHRAPCRLTFRFVCLQQQMHAQQLPHAGHAPPLPMMPHPALPGPPSTAASLLGLSGALGAPASHPLSMLAAKPDMHRDEAKTTTGKYSGFIF